MALQPELKEVPVNIHTMTASVEITNEDKLFLVAGGMMYEVEIPAYGNIVAKVIDNRVIDFHYESKLRVPGRQQRKK